MNYAVFPWEIFTLDGVSFVGNVTRLKMMLRERF